MITLAVVALCAAWFAAGYTIGRDTARDRAWDRRHGFHAPDIGPDVPGGGAP